MYAGQLFGDVGTLLQSTYRASVRSQTHVELLAIDWSDLVSVLNSYPSIKKRAHSYALRVHGIDVDDLKESSTD